MKKVLLLLILSSTSLIAQDSTYIDYDTENVSAFKPTRLVEEFEKAYGLDENVNFRVKAGFEDFGVVLPFEQKSLVWNAEFVFFDSWSALADLKLNPSVNYRSWPGVSGTVAVRRYFHKKSEPNNLSGNYLQLSFEKRLSDLQSRNSLIFQYGSENFRHFIESAARPGSSGGNQIMAIALGKQLGGVGDFGLRAGLVKVHDFSLNSSNTQIFVSPANEVNKPFIASFSRFTVGLDFPLNNKKNKEACDFLNCFQGFNRMFTFGLSNLFYVDEFNQNLNLNFRFEQKFGDFPFSVNTELISNLNRFRYYSNFSSNPQVSNFQVRTASSLYLAGEGQLRYYLGQTKRLLKGLGVKNLSGPYMGFFYGKGRTRILTDSEHFETEFQDIIKWGIVGGLQRKVMNQYFVDFALKVGGLSFPGWEGNLSLGPSIKFGYAL